MEKLPHVNAEKVVIADKIDTINFTENPTLEPYRPRVEWTPTDTSRFHYSSRATPLFGRDAELQRLRDFCLGNENPFRWWLATGKGGMGKSRLALELALELEDTHGWDWMFLGRDASVLKRNLGIIAANRWQPEKPTLLISDYAAFVAPELRAALDICIAEAGGWAHKVRLLVLERTISGGWYEQLTTSGFGARQCGIVDSRHEAEPLALEPLSTRQGEEIVTAVLKRYEQEPPSDLAALLERLDLEHRPLFALFLADTLRGDDAENRCWRTKTEMIDGVLSREMARWSELGVRTDDLRLLRFATMAGEIDLQQDGVHERIHPYVKSLLESVLDESARPSPADRWSVILHADTEFARIPRLEPDLLGELFVLKEITLPANKFKWEEAGWRAEFEATWQHNLGVGLIGFVHRAAQDFPEHGKLDKLITAFEDCRPKDEAFLVPQAFLSAVLTGAFGAHRQFEKAHRTYLALRSLTETWPDILPIAEILALAAFNLTIDYRAAGNIEAAHALYDDLKAIAEMHADNTKIVLEQTKMAVNLTVDYGKVGNIEAARALYDDIKAIAGTHMNNAAIALEQTKAAFNLTIGYRNADNIGAARALYDDLKAIARMFADNTEIALVQAKVIVNLTATYDDASNIEGMHALHDVLKAIAGTHADNEEIASTQAKAVVNLVICYGNVGDIETAHSLYNDLKAVAKAHADNEEIALNQAEAVVNLAHDYGDAGNIETARALYNDLKAIARAHANNAKIALAQANAAFNIALDYNNAGNIEAAYTLYNDLKALAEAHADNTEIALAQAKEAVNLMIDYSNIGNVETAHALYDDLEAIAKTHVDNMQMASIQAQAASYLTAFFSLTGNIEAASSLYHDLNTIAGMRADNKEIAFAKARAAGVLAVVNSNANDVKAARSFYKDLKVLAETHPGNPEIEDWRARVDAVLSDSKGKGNSEA